MTVLLTNRGLLNFFGISFIEPKLPIFLVPYENKNVTFNKNINNKFVLFKFLNWDNKHPNGELINGVPDKQIIDKLVALIINSYRYGAFSLFAFVIMEIKL